MAEIIRMPRLSDTMEEGNIVSWLKKEGDSVAPGDVLAEVETDKATMELESFFEGTLLHIGVKEGPVPVDGIIAIIGDKSEDYKTILAEAESNSVNEAKESPEENKSETPPTPSKVSTPAPVMEVQSSNSGTVGSSSEGRIFASPLAKTMAKERGIDLNLVRGSGEGGRIIKKDIESYVPSTSNGMQATTGKPVIGTQTVEYGDMPVSQMRKVIARRLGESKFSAPHFYLTVEINMDYAIKARKEINAESEVRISFNDFIVKASAAALRKHPMINASWLEDKIKVHEEINIGVAVSVKDGLLVPVIKNADQKTLSYINQEVKSLAQKAKEKKLQPQEMTGNTFTISNLGMFDIDEFTAIINPPDACILAVGGISQKPIVKDGELAIGNIMKVTLSCDHRIVDGVAGAQFLHTLKGMLENPFKILV